jgi:hypothetical protein
MRIIVVFTMKVNISYSSVVYDLRVPLNASLK